MRVIFRPPIPMDEVLDNMMEEGMASTKSALLVQLLWLGIDAKREMIHGKNE